MIGSGFGISEGCAEGLFGFRRSGRDDAVVSLENSVRVGYERANAFANHKRQNGPRGQLYLLDCPASDIRLRQDPYVDDLETSIADGEEVCEGMGGDLCLNVLKDDIRAHDGDVYA